MPKFKCAFVDQDKKTIIGDVDEVDAPSPEDAAVFYKKRSAHHDRACGPIIGVYDNNWESIQTFGVQQPSEDASANVLQVNIAKNVAHRDAIRNSSAYSEFRTLIFLISVVFIFIGAISGVVGLTNIFSGSSIGISRLFSGLFMVAGAIACRQFIEIIVDIADLKIQNGTVTSKLQKPSESSIPQAPVEF